ncbi:MAG: DUF2834 domain-containing protein [Gammaproteobacteria bacterium]|nr:DUF2834 domain-containing protein [Gammaproteobacteria bacterium]
MQAKGIRVMKHVYLILAITGAVVPYVFFVDFFGAHGVSFVGFATALFANGASAGFAADLFISSFVFWLYMFSRPAAPRPWLFIVLNLIIGLSCALPAYLYADARSRAF